MEQFKNIECNNLKGRLKKRHKKSGKNRKSTAYTTIT